MNEIKDIVNGIVRGCSRGGVEVTEVLAAFIARTVSSFSKLLIRLYMN